MTGRSIAIESTKISRLRYALVACLLVGGCRCGSTAAQPPADTTLGPATRPLPLSGPPLPRPDGKDLPLGLADTPPLPVTSTGAVLAPGERTVGDLFDGKPAKYPPPGVDPYEPHNKPAPGATR